MFGTIQTQSITFYKTEATAQALADANGADDTDTTYTVEPRPRGFVVVVRDAVDGLVLGTL